MVAHAEVDQAPAQADLAYKVIRPQLLPFISYLYEWCFSLLQDAALATLEIQKRALAAGMSLKDSSAYNIQFLSGHPVLVDTLSFERYPEGQPWIAYRQYCQHFLAPLALAAYTDIRLSQLTRMYIDGVPLDLAARLLPRKTRFNLGLFTHIHLHASAQQRYANQTTKTSGRVAQMNRTSFLGLIDHLESTVRSLKWKPAGTEWGDYYSRNATHYSQQALVDKKQVIDQMIARLVPRQVWDLGANTGFFSRLTSERGFFTVAFDIDPAAVEQNYLASRQEKQTNLLPLVMDLTNPSPALGWHHRERSALLERGPVDLVLALALIHHLAISNNVPLSRLAQFFRQAGRWLVLEFVPKEDSQVQLLLASRQDIFYNYSLQGLLEAFRPYFRVHEQVPLKDTQRVILLMESM